MNLLWIVLIAFFGSTLQASSGFGYAIVTMSLWPLIVPLREAAVMEAITAIFMTAGLAVKLRKHINLRLLAFPLTTSILFSFFGVSTLMSGTETLLRRVFGGILLLLSCYFVFFSNKIKWKPSLKNGMTAGAISGFFSGLFNLGGPPMVIYYLSITDDKMEYSATMQCFFTINLVILLINHLMVGNITTTILHHSLIAMAGLLTGTLCGFCLFQKFSTQVIKKTVYLFMSVFGVYLIAVG